MTDLDHQVSALLRAGSADLDAHLGWDPDALARGGLALGRRRRHRRRVASSLAALALVVVAGVGVALGVGDDTRRAVDPPVAETPSASASPSSLEPTTGPRGLAITAAGLPGTFTSLLPGDVSVPAAKPGEENPMDGFDPRQRVDGAPPFPDSEPGPGIYADLVWDGVPVRVAVAPTDPAYGDTPLERCVGAGEGGNGTCVATPDGGVLQETSSTADEGYEVRVVTRWTPDLWQVTAMKNGPGDGPTLAQLRTVVESDAWFR
jgi:hypothetical protein